MESQPLRKMGGFTSEAMPRSQERTSAEPGYLKHPPRPHVLVVSMEGPGRTTEGQEGPGDRRHFRRIIFEIGPGAQNAEPTTRRRPLLIEVDEHGHDLAPMVGMDVSITGFAMCAQRYVAGVLLEVGDPELLSEHADPLWPRELVEELSEIRTVFESGQAVVAWLRDRREIPHDAADARRVEKFLDHEEGERLGFSLGDFEIRYID